VLVDELAPIDSAIDPGEAPKACEELAHEVL
jgi:hypothetical protein